MHNREIVLDDFESKPNSFSVRVDLQNMHIESIKNKLAPFGLRSWAIRFEYNIKEAPYNDFSIIKQFSTMNCDPRNVAFLLLREIYLWFGMEEDKIPYTKLEGDIRIVDPEKIIDPKE